MQTNHNSSFVAIILGGLLFAATTIPAAYAFDATGTWEGSWKCTGFYDGYLDRSSEDNSVIEISQVGDELRVDLDGGEYFYAGLIINDGTKPDKRAQTGLVACNTTNDSSAPTSEVIHVRLTGGASVDPKAKFRGRSVYAGKNGSPWVGGCNWKYKRTSRVDPGVLPCPP